jgi:hypothetical protein
MPCLGMGPPTFCEGFGNSLTSIHTSQFDRFRKTVIKYCSEDYYGIYVYMKIIDLEFWILFIWLDSPVLPSIFIMKFES